MKEAYKIVPSVERINKEKKFFLSQNSISQGHPMKLVAVDSGQTERNNTLHE